MNWSTKRPVIKQDTDTFSDAFLCDLLKIDHKELQYAIQSLNNLASKAPKYQDMDEDVAGTILSIAGLNPATCSGIEAGIKIGLIIAESRNVTKALVQ